MFTTKKIKCLIGCSGMYVFIVTNTFTRNTSIDVSKKTASFATRCRIAKFSWRSTTRGLCSPSSLSLPCSTSLLPRAVHNVDTIRTYRLLSGVFDCSPMAIVSGALTDFWTPTERGVLFVIMQRLNYIIYVYLIYASSDTLLSSFFSVRDFRFLQRQCMII